MYDVFTKWLLMLSVNNQRNINERMSRIDLRVSRRYNLLRNVKGRKLTLIQYWLTPADNKLS